MSRPPPRLEGMRVPGGGNTSGWLDLRRQQPLAARDAFKSPLEQCPVVAVQMPAESARAVNKLQPLLAQPPAQVEVFVVVVEFLVESAGPQKRLGLERDI